MSGSGRSVDAVVVCGKKKKAKASEKRAEKPPAPREILRVAVEPQARQSRFLITSLRVISYRPKMAGTASTSPSSLLSWCSLKPQHLQLWRRGHYAASRDALELARLLSICLSLSQTAASAIPRRADMMLAAERPGSTAAILCSPCSLWNCNIFDSEAMVTTQPAEMP